MREEKFICDNCDKDVADTEMGKMYGPICLMVTAPKWPVNSLTGEFCSLECATLWMNCTVPRKVS